MATMLTYRATEQIWPTSLLSGSFPHLAGLEAEPVYERLGQRLDRLDLLVNCFDVLGNGTLGGSRVGNSCVVKFSLGRAGAQGLCGDPYHLATLLQCFIGHTLQMVMSTATFNPLPTLSVSSPGSSLRTPQCRHNAPWVLLGGSLSFTWFGM